jgi:hypothetical protein
MKKQLFVILILVLILFFTACCDENNAAFIIHNNSQFDVTEISVKASSYRSMGYKEILKPDESCTLITEWLSSNITEVSISFFMNEEEFGSMEKKEITDTRRFKSHKRIRSGSRITVRIYDDRWTW